MVSISADGAKVCERTSDLQSAVRNLPWQVVLASASPRRSDLLRELVEEFIVDPAHVDEDALTEPDPWVTAQRLAREKALVVFDRHPNSLVIGGDTVVAFPKDGNWDNVEMPLERKETSWVQLGKPENEADAKFILESLSGQKHVVVTGVCLVWPGGFAAFTETTYVTFKPMGDQEIAAYIATGEPMDKAGAYGFQGGARPFVQRVEGSVSNVIGLPLERLEETLRDLMKRS